MTNPENQEPYVGPRPFKREESEFFFGRTREVNDLVSLISSYHVVLLYAQSGAGKTSLLKASLLPELEQEKFAVLEPARIRMQEALEIPVSEIENIFVFNALSYWNRGRYSQTELAKMTLATFVKNYRKSHDETAEKPLVLIFDQFEEIFTHHLDRWEDRENFFSQIEAALSSDTDMRVYFVMREDYIAELDPYAHMLPGKLRTRFRMEQLRRENALEAITGPLAAPSLEKKGLHFGKGVAEDLVEDLLKIRVQTPNGEKEVQGQFVEPVQLQVVCQALWHTLKKGEQEITFKHLNDFGNVNEALTKFYERTIKLAAKESGASEGTLRRWFDRVLITPDGNRSTVLQGKNDTGGIPNTAIAIFERERLLRSEPRDNRLWFELGQDRLIKPIQNSYKKWLADQPGEQIRVKLEKRADEWNRSGRPKELLFNSGDLLVAKEWVKAEPTSGSYSDALFALIKATEFEIKATEFENIEKEREKDRQLAQEQSLRADAEAARAAALELATKRETARAEAEKERAEAEKERAAALELAAEQEAARAEEKSKANRRLSYALAATAAMFILAMAFGFIARIQRVKAQSNYEQAEKNRVAAEKAVDIAQFRAREAQHQTEVAEKERRKALDEKERADAATKQEKASKEKAIAATARAVTAEKNAIKAQETETELRKKAEREGYYSRSRELAANALLQLNTDPELALLFAVKSAETTPPPDEKEPLLPPRESRDALIKAIEAQRTVSLIRPQNGPALAAQVSPDTQTVVTVNFSDKVEFWNAFKERTPQRTTRSVQGPASQIRSFAFSSNGKFAATTTGEAAQIWSIDDPTKYTELADKGLKITQAAVNSSGTLALTIGDDQFARLWDVNTKRIIVNLALESDPFSPPAQNQIYTAKFNPDESSVIITNDKIAVVWEINRESIDEWKKVEGPIDFFPQLSLGGHVKRVNSVAISSRTNLLATASEDATARLWDAGNGELKFQLLGHVGPVKDVNFSPDGTRVVTAGDDGTARIWDTATGLTKAVLRGHKKAVTGASFSADGKYVVTVSDDGTSRVWESRSDAGDEVLKGHTAAISDVAISPNGSIVTASYDGTARIWNTAGEQKAVLQGHRAVLNKVIISSAGNYIATAGADDTVWVWNSSGVMVRVIKGIETETAISDIAFSPDEKYLAVSFFQGGIRVWDIANGQTAAKFDPSEDESVKQIVFSPNGTLLAAVYFDLQGTVQLWDVARNQSEHVFTTISKGETAAPLLVNAVFSNDGKRLAVANAAGSAFVWTLTKQPAGPLKVDTHVPDLRNKVFFSSDDKYLVSLGKQKGWVWDAATGEIHVVLIGHTDDISSAAISKKGYVLAAGSENGAVQVWDIRSGERLAEFLGQTTFISAVAISDDNTKIVTASFDSTGRILSCNACGSIEQILEVARTRRFDQSTIDELNRILMRSTGSCTDCYDLPGLLQSARRLLIPN
jgi:WD40 repeat protein